MGTMKAQLIEKWGKHTEEEILIINSALVIYRNSFPNTKGAKLVLEVTQDMIEELSIMMGE